MPHPGTSADDRLRRFARRRDPELRFEDDLTQAEIGAIVGLSQMRVSRLLRLSIDKLRDAAITPEAVAA